MTHYRYICYIIMILLVGSMVVAMDTTIDTARSSMEAEEFRHKLIMDNVSNIKTKGYRAANGKVYRNNNEEVAYKRYTSQKQGHFVNTGRNLDFAIEGKGFFTVRADSGKIFYTRDGRFKLDNQSRLRTISGDFLVLGQGGPIVYDQSNQETQITQTGKVVQDEVVIDRLLISVFDDPSQLQAVNGSFFITSSDFIVPGYVEDYRLRKGYVEGSNVDMAKQLIELPQTQKLYDANSKIIQSRLKTMSYCLEMGKIQ